MESYRALLKVFIFSPLSTRLLRTKGPLESEFTSVQPSKVSKNLLSMFDDESDGDEDLDF